MTTDIRQSSWWSDTDCEKQVTRSIYQECFPDWTGSDNFNTNFFWESPCKGAPTVSWGGFSGSFSFGDFPLTKWLQDKISSVTRVVCSTVSDQLLFTSIQKIPPESECRLLKISKDEAYEIMRALTNGKSYVSPRIDDILYADYDTTGYLAGPRSVTLKNTIQSRTAFCTCEAFWHHYFTDRYFDGSFSSTIATSVRDWISISEDNTHQFLSDCTTLRCDFSMVTKSLEKTVQCFRHFTYGIYDESNGGTLNPALRNTNLALPSILSVNETLPTRHPESISVFRFPLNYEAAADFIEQITGKRPQLPSIFSTIPSWVTHLGLVAGSALILAGLTYFYGGSIYRNWIKPVCRRRRPLQPEDLEALPPEQRDPVCLLFSEITCQRVRPRRLDTDDTLSPEANKPPSKKRN